MGTSVGTGPQRTAAGGSDGAEDSSSDHSCRSEKKPPGGGRGCPRGGGEPPHRGNGNVNGNGNSNSNGDDNGDKGDQSSISSHRGPPGPQGLQGPSGPQGPQGPQGIQGGRGLQGPPGRQGNQGIHGIPGKRGPQGFKGPHGQTTTAQPGQPQLNPNITTLDTSGLEISFQAVGDAMNQLAEQQQIVNVQLNQSLMQQQQERGHMVAVMDKVASATLQSSYDSIFASIPVYDGSDTKEFWSWFHRIESACSYTKQNLHLEAMGKSTGKVLNTIMSIPQNYAWSIVKKGLSKRVFGIYIALAHATAELDYMQQEEGEPLKLNVH